MLIATLTQNRGDQPRYVTLIQYAHNQDVCQATRLTFQPGVYGDKDAFTCTRITALPLNRIARPEVPREPTIVTTTRESLIAQGLLKPAQAARWRVSLKALAAKLGSP